jgi:aminopeptidase N
VDIENARLAGIQLFGTLNLEEKQVQIAKITEVLYAIQELSQKDPKYRKGMLQERDRKIAQEQAKARDAKVAKVKDAKAESRPALIDVNLEEFAKRWEYTEQEAKTQLTSYKKQIKVMTDIMGNLEKATQAVDEVMTKGLEARRRA